MTRARSYPLSGRSVWRLCPRPFAALALVIANATLGIGTLGIGTLRIATLAIATLGIATLGIATPVRADTFVVTTTADTIAADGLVSLREAIALANGNAVADTIVLTPGSTYPLSLCAAGALVVNGPANLEVDGQGSTVVQTCTDQRLFEKTAPNTTTLTLRNLVLVSAPNSGVNATGAAIQATSQLELDGVQIDGADAGPGGSVVEVDFGAATFDLVVSNSQITNSDGTAISNANPVGVRVTGSVLSGNTGSGIAISDGSPLEIVDTTIADNGGTGVITSGQGFGLQPDVAITGSTIHGNGGGGFRCSSACRTLVVTQTTITNNGATAAPDRGGAIIMPIVMTAGPTPSVTVTDSTISGNIANHPGGGLFVFPGFASDAAVQPAVTINRSTFADNTVNCAGCGGGAVAVHLGSLSVTDASFTGNQAPGAGGALEVKRSLSDSITAPAILTLTGVTISGNQAGGNGGGASVQVDQTTIDSSRFSGNTAGGDGGAISAGGVFDNGVVVSGETAIQNSTLAGNQAQRGGAVRLSFPDGSRVQMLNSTVDGNTAALAGGGFLVGPTERLVLDHVTSTRNAAPSGANLATSGPTTLRRSVIAQPSGSANCATVLGAPPLVVPNLTSAGGNVFSDASCEPGAADLVTAADPVLGELADNGGPTPTRLPGDASPVVSVVPIADCSITTDQRGATRPAGDGCEAGAVEIVGAQAGLPFPVKLGDHGDLTLKLRHGSEAIRLVFGADKVVVTYDADRADGSNPIATATFVGPFRDLRIRMDGGHDRLEIQGGELRNLELSMGKADDEVVLTGIRVHRQLLLQGGQGKDTIHATDVRTGDLKVDLGPGNDRFDWIKGRVDGSAQLLAGPGNDQVGITESLFAGHSLFVGGGGQDQLVIDALTTFGRPPRITGF